MVLWLTMHHSLNVTMHIIHVYVGMCVRVCVEQIGQKSAHSEWYVYKFLSLLDSDRQWQENKWSILHPILFT